MVLAFAVDKRKRPPLLVSTRTGKARPSLLQPNLHIKVSNRWDKAFFVALAATSPKSVLEKIVKESKAILQEVGIPTRVVVAVEGASYRELTEKEEAGVVLNRWIETFHAVPGKRGRPEKRLVRTKHPTYREFTEQDKTNAWEIPVMDARNFCPDDSVEHYAAYALQHAVCALIAMGVRQNEHTVTDQVLGKVPFGMNYALIYAMRALDYHWKMIFLQYEPATLAGLDILHASKRKADPEKIKKKLAEVRNRNPHWGVTAIRQQAAEELRQYGRGYGFESLKKYPVPEGKSARRSRKC